MSELEKVWIKKGKYDFPTNEYRNSFLFSINEKPKGNVYSNIKNILKMVLKEKFDYIYEDLFIIALSIFSVDKKIQRKNFYDNWTRVLKISIPVLNFEKWVETKSWWERLLSYLTGDIWDINFRKTDVKYLNLQMNISPLKHANVSLFSGGLDSFCGAIDLLERETSCLFIGYNEYPRLRKRQEELFNIIYKENGDKNINFFNFSANSRPPVKKGIKAKDKDCETSSRGRSLLFLSAAILIAGCMGESIPVYIPENGFIGINIPLTNSRRGSCSTRTTHPFFINDFNDLLKHIGIKNKIINQFSYKSKKDIVELVKSKRAFIEGAGKTISCSHPCVARWEKNEYPINCGYCYPCLIRKSSLVNMNIKNDIYSHDSVSYKFIKENPKSKKINDLVSLINTVYRYKISSEKEIKRLIQINGKISNNEAELFFNLYKSTMEDLIQLFSEDEKLKEYIGL